MSNCRELVREHHTARVPTASPGETLGAALARVAGATPPIEAAEALWVVEEGRLLGAVRMSDALSAPARLARDAMAAVPAVHPDDDQERAIQIAIEHGLDAVPVVDSAGTFLGVIPSVTLLATQRREHVEDLHRLAGIAREATTESREAMDAPPLRSARHRLPWLLLGLAGASAATLLVARFEAALERRIALAFFLPGIVYLADAVGTQTEAIAVRGLSLSRATLRHLLANELKTGVLIGVALGLLSGIGAMIGMGDVQVGVAVGLAVVAASAVAASVGLFFPWILARLQMDPAFGSGPIATVIQDTLSIAIYFGIASAIVR